MIKTFTINPGSTSTKIGYFEDIEPVFCKTIRHDVGRLSSFPRIIDQLGLRKKEIEKLVSSEDIDIDRIDFFIGRGGILKPLESGLYEINNKMIADLESARYGEHASNLGAILAYHFAKKAGKTAYILDPVCVDEMEPVSRISGHPLIKRKSIFHALNHKKIALNAADRLGRKYSDINLIIAHLGGGISVGLHKKGRIVDVNNALAGEGPFTPERTGGLPLADFCEYIIKEDLDIGQVKKIIAGKGGLSAYFGTNDFSDIMKRYENSDSEVGIVIDSMAYQVAKAIGAVATFVNGNIDAIVLTGGLAFSDTFTGLIKKRVGFISKKIYVFAGEDELLAMAEGALNHVKGRIEIKKY